MNKREYIQANKDWLEAKSKEEGVKACCNTRAEVGLTTANPLRSLTSHPTAPNIW